MLLKLYAVLFDKDHLIPNLSPPLWILITDIIPSYLPNLSFLYVMKISSIPSNDNDQSVGLPSYHVRSWYYEDEETYRSSERQSQSILSNRLLPEPRGSLSLERSW